jgi:hypothetical protein
MPPTKKYGRLSLNKNQGSQGWRQALMLFIGLCRPQSP